MFRGKKRPISRVAAVLALALVVVALAACGGGSGKPDFNNKAQVFTDKGGNLTVDSKRAFVIALEANPSTGFEWTIPQKPDPKIVKFQKKQYVAPQGGAAGAPGTERFRFKALKPGQVTIKLKYAKPSTPDAADNLNYTYNVTVVAKK
jgi:inhibitor of cysteine peptidase